MLPFHIPFSIINQHEHSWLSDISVSPVVAGDGERCWCGCQHASSRRRLIWIRSRTQEARQIRPFREAQSVKANASATPTFFPGVFWACTHTPGTILRRWPAWLRTSQCTGPRRSHTCGAGYTWARRQHRTLASDLCQLTLSRDRTGRRTAAWCWPRTKTRLSWCRCLQHTWCHQWLLRPLVRWLYDL